MKNIRSIMADMDIGKRDELLEEIPQAKLLLCKYHSQGTFKGKVTTEKMGIGLVWFAGASSS